MPRSTAELRRLWGPPCDGPYVTRMMVPGVRVTVHAAVTEAVQALGSVFLAHRYPVRPGDTGAYNCRMITGGTNYSLHAYGIAVDVNWNSNPYRKDRLVTDMAPPMLRDVYRIRTVEGVPVWRWGGDWDQNPSTTHSAYDAMHFEVITSPAELSAGVDWETVLQPPRDPSRPDTWPVLHPGERGPTVRELQMMLGIPADGIYGPQTAGAVRAYQVSRGLTPDGIVGLQTWTALLTDQPRVGGPIPSPVKLPVR